MTDALLGRQLENYRIERLLGQGGMAKVYYGTDVKLMRPVAIKVLDERLQANQAYAQRFVREAQTVAAWRHENVLQVYYADESDGIYYFVTEYIDGADLGKMLDEYTRLGELMPHADVLHIGRAIASALDYAHKLGVIHRDVKPANVLVERSGRVVLGDFGLALDVQQGTLGEVLGTPQYISPEQARHSAEAVPASDLYSLGVILYEMLTGVVPFDDPSPTTVAVQHITLLPPPPREINPQLSEETERVLLKALNKKPQARYPSGEELMNALEKGLSAPAPSQAMTGAPSPLPADLSGQPKRLSHLTVLEILATRPPQIETVPPRTTSKVPESPPPTVGDTSPYGYGKKLALPAVLGGCALLLILALAVTLALLQGPFSPTESAAVQPPMTETASLAARATTQAGALLTLPVPSATSRSSSSAEAGTVTIPLPEITATGTSMSAPTETQSPPTETQVPPTETQVPPTETQAPPDENTTAAPTVKYPQGRHIRLYYNENGFYLFSLVDEIFAIEPIAFERLEASGTPSNRFDGFEWAKLYPYIWPDTCMKAEIRGSQPYSPPSGCQGYNASRTFKRDEGVVFWTALEGSSQFRVLWDEEEVARCEIAASVCDVFLP
jgi:serine/threonine protein kinase